MKCTVIGIAGGTGSGKSTFTARIKAAFPDKVAVLYHDNYYKAHDNIPFEERKTINYDHPNSLETDLLIEHVKSLKNDKSVDAPTYDFTQHTRAEATLHIEPKPIIIIEGILTLQNVELVNLMDIKIFVEADADERILRRAIRDVKERGRDLEGVAEQYLQTVKPMHYLYVEPTKNVADIVINSGMNDVAFDIVSTKIKALLGNIKMIPKVIHYCWFGGKPIPKEYMKYIDSWKKYLPDYEIKRWDESNFDVHCNKFVEAAYNAGKYAFVSDFARFQILANGGYTLIQMLK